MPARVRACLGDLRRHASNFSRTKIRIGLTLVTCVTTYTATAASTQVLRSRAMRKARSGGKLAARPMASNMTMSVTTTRNERCFSYSSMNVLPCDDPAEHREEAIQLSLLQFLDEMLYPTNLVQRSSRPRVADRATHGSQRWRFVDGANKLSPCFFSCPRS